MPHQNAPIMLRKTQSLLKCLVIICLFIPSLLFAQSVGTLTGKITNAANNEVLVGVIISGEKGNFRTSDVEGRFSAKLAPGTYKLRFAYTGFKTKTISDVVIESGKTTELNIVLEEAASNLTEVVVSANSARRETAASLLSIQKSNISVSDGISSEIIRKSPDNNVGEVLKRVTGTSVQDDKYVIVRGLNDRYNVATINGAVMPSTEPDRRTFSFDVVPSNMIDNVLINKTATPDMPGEFSGGIVQVTTKDIPFKNSFGIGMGLSYNTISTGKDFNIGYMGSMDFLGFDDGSRKFPTNFPSTSRWRVASRDQQIGYSRLMTNTYGDRYDGAAFPASNLQLNWAQKFNTDNGATFGILASVTYRNSQTIQYTKRNQYNDITSTNNYLFDYNDSSYAFTSSVGGLLNLGYKKGKSKIVFKNLFNRVFENTNTLREGSNYNDLQYINKGQISIVMQKSIISSQLEGEHSVGAKNSKFKWNLNYTFTQKDQPDYKSLPFQKSLSQINDKSIPTTVALRNTYRFWSTLNEHTFGGKLDYNTQVNFLSPKAQFKAGTLAQYKTREFDARAFRYEQAGSVFNTALLQAKPERVFSDAYMYNEGFYLNEITNNTDRYDANSMLTGSYAMLENKWNQLKMIWGVRVETFNYEVNTGNVSGTREVIKKNYLDILPSLNLIYSLDQKNNIRFSASRTVSRPDFREVANFSYFDFVRAAVIRGNSKLERSQNTNLDLRFETYPSAGEIFSVSAFFKHFQNPIEQQMSGESTFEYQVITFFNPAFAYTYGLELDLRKKLSFLGEGRFLENTVFSANAALMQSRVDLNEAGSWDKDRPMQGQSPYLLNFGFTYADPVTDWGGTILFNRIGHRIETVGKNDIPDVYENGRSILDVQLSKKVLRKQGEIKLNIGNILNAKQIFYNNVQGQQTKRAYNASTDRIQWSNVFGTTFGLSFNYNFGR